MARHVTGVVDDDIPGATSLEQLQTVVDLRVAVAHDLLDAAIEQTRAIPAIEHRDLMPARERVLDLVRSDKSGATEEEEVQGAVTGHDF